MPRSRRKSVSKRKVTRKGSKKVSRRKTTRTVSKKKTSRRKTRSGSKKKTVVRTRTITRAMGVPKKSPKDYGDLVTKFDIWLATRIASGQMKIKFPKNMVTRGAFLLMLEIMAKKKVSSGEAVQLAMKQWNKMSMREKKFYVIRANAIVKAVPKIKKRMR